MARMNIPGSIYRRSNGKYQGVAPEVYDPTLGKRRRPGLGAYDTRREAKEALVRFHEQRSNSGTYLTGPELRRRKLNHWLDEWLVLIEGQQRSGKLGVRTVAGYRTAVDLHIRPALGHVRIGDLNHLVVHRWLTGLSENKGLSDRTVQRMYRTRHRALSDAPLAQNPSALPKHLRPTVRDAKPVYRPTPEEIKAFLAHTSECPKSDYLSTLWRVAAFTGARRGELVAIEWADIDLDSRLLQITKSIGYDGADLFVKGTKNEGTRVVGLDDITVGMIVDEQERHLSDREKLGGEYIEKPLGLDLVFRRDETGRLCHPNRVSQAFGRELKHAGPEPRSLLAFTKAQPRACSASSKTGCGHHRQRSLGTVLSGDHPQWRGRVHRRDLCRCRERIRSDDPK